MLADQAANLRHPRLSDVQIFQRGGHNCPVAFGWDCSHAHDSGARSRWIAVRTARTLEVVKASSASLKVMARAWPQYACHDLVQHELKVDQRRPAEGVFALLEEPLGGATLAVESHHPIGLHGQVDDDEADAGNSSPACQSTMTIAQRRTCQAMRCGIFSCNRGPLARKQRTWI